MYRILASDMDETFIGAGYTVHPDNLKAIDAMEGAGGMFVVATGRPFSSVQDTLELIGHKGRRDRFCITYNGGYVARCDGEVLASHTLDPAVADAIYAFGAERGLCMHIYAGDVCFVANITPAEKDYLAARMETVPCDGLLPSELGLPVYKVLFHDPDMDYLHDLERKFAQARPELVCDLEVVYSSERYLEYNPKGVSKGAALLELADVLGIAHSDTIAVGDSANDLSMLESAGLGLAVRNRSDEVKRLIGPGRTLERTCDDGAMWEIWYRYIEPSATAEACQTSRDG
jgi:hypothetical protein